MSFTIIETGQLEDGSPAVLLRANTNADIELMESMLGQDIELVADEAGESAEAVFHHSYQDSVTVADEGQKDKSNDAPS